MRSPVDISRDLRRWHRMLPESCRDAADCVEQLALEIALAKKDVAAHHDAELWAWKERDAAVARADKAETALRWIHEHLAATAATTVDVDIALAIARAALGEDAS